MSMSMRGMRSVVATAQQVGLRSGRNKRVEYNRINLKTFER